MRLCETSEALCYKFSINCQKSFETKSLIEILNKLLNRFSHFRQFSDSFSSISGDQRDGEGGALQHNLLRENLRVTELRNKLSCRK